MAHYAFITSNIVTEVIVGRDENDLPGGVDSWEDYYATKRNGQTCKRTSYNTFIDENGKPKHANGKTPFRGCYAGIGYSYDEQNDVFIPNGWSYDDVEKRFIPPTTEPEDA